MIGDVARDCTFDISTLILNYQCNVWKPLFCFQTQWLVSKLLSSSSKVHLWVAWQNHRKSFCAKGTKLCQIVSEWPHVYESMGLPMHYCAKARKGQHLRHRPGHCIECRVVTVGHLWGTSRELHLTPRPPRFCFASNASTSKESHTAQQHAAPGSLNWS